MLRLSASFLSVVVIMYVHLLCCVPKNTPTPRPPLNVHLLDSHLRQVLAARLCKLLKVRGEV